jgi:predicted metal-dependent hydrolase
MLSILPCSSNKRGLSAGSSMNIVNKILRTRRKTLALEIMPDETVIVRAPQKAPMERIFAFVRSKLSWIIEKKQYVRQRYPKEIDKKFEEGEEFLFLGEPCRLSIGLATNPPLILNEKNFVLSGENIERAKELFQKWYRVEALKLISERVKYYSEITGLEYSRLRISNAQRRWGSCSARGSLNFSWRLIMAPLAVIDYVIVHELSHIKIKNHSKNFWLLVESIYPDYKAQRKWLRNNYHLLKI